MAGFVGCKIYEVFPGPFCGDGEQFLEVGWCGCKKDEVVCICHYCNVVSVDMRAKTRALEEFEEVM